MKKNKNKFQIEYIPTIDLIPYARNAKEHEEEQVSDLVGSINEFDFYNPIQIDKDNIIISGHGRLLAAQRLKIETLPVIRRNDLSDVKVKAMRLIDNKVADKAKYDNNMVKLEVEEIKLAGYDVNLDMFNDVLIEQEEIPNNKNDNDNEYTKKIVSPIYEPKGEKPKIEQLYDISKTKKLIDEIEKSTLSDNEKKFLILAAYRHIVFSYEDIAEYYAHAGKDTQDLMEKSALIIIDFNKAIENGFVVLANEIAEEYTHDQE